ncbi:MAG: hypothetical protein RLO51_24215 [Thalassobaculum sp.]|uniref:hypothetical protein n=1 Tax=Thalassobaculum sp. TaxID=2022740 RepID=UPI0032EF101C
MSDPEDPRDPNRDPDSADPVPAEPDKPSLWQVPVVRAVANGAFFAVMLCVIQVFGIFREAQSLDDETIAANIVAGVVFGFVMYIVELWRWHRRGKRRVADRNTAAAEAARRTVEDRLNQDQAADPDDRR